MTHLSGDVRVYKGKHRLYQPLVAITTLGSSIAIAANVLTYGRMVLNVGDHMSVESARFPKEVKLPIFGPIQLALQNIEPNSVVVGIDPAPATWQPGAGGVAVGIVRITLYVVSPVFVEYFERHLPWLETNVSTN